MTVYDFLAALIGLVCGLYVGFVYGKELGRDEATVKVPMIDANLPCPGCGHVGSKLQFLRGGVDPNIPKSVVYRTCSTCGCQVTHPPVAPALFEKVDSART